METKVVCNSLRHDELPADMSNVRVGDTNIQYNRGTSTLTEVQRETYLKELQHITKGVVPVEMLRQVVDAWDTHRHLIENIVIEHKANNHARADVRTDRSEPGNVAEAK